MTKTEAMKIVCVLFGSFPNARFNEQNFESYAEGIQELDATTCGAAAQRLIRTSKFLPSIAEIREATVAQTLGPVRSGEEAWAELMLAKRKHGYDYGAIDARRRLRDPLFGDPVIARCLTMWGGWNAFALADDDAADRARFCALFASHVGRERQDLVAGKALPMPERAPALLFERPKPRTEPPAPMPVAQIKAVLSPETSRPPSPYAGRKLTAAEIDAALGGTGRATDEAAQ
jgi:hypothetical protein